MTIQENLKQIVTWRNKIAKRDKQMDKWIMNQLNPAQRAEFKQIQDDISEFKKVANEKLDQLEKAVKEEVLNLKETVRGDGLMAVYIKEGVSWDTQLLFNLATRIPEIKEAQKKKEPFVQIKASKPF
jgi:hypothetical protein